MEQKVNKNYFRTQAIQDVEDNLPPQIPNSKEYMKYYEQEKCCADCSCEELHQPCEACWSFKK